MDIESKGANNKASTLRTEDDGDLEAFPAPKHVFSIWSPLVHVVEAAAQVDRRATVWKGFMEETVSIKKKKRLKVKIGSLITKMMNRLLQDNVIAYDRICVVHTPSSIFLQILVGERTIPILMLRCEKLGIGTVVGSCFVTPLDLAMVPKPTVDRQALRFPILPSAPTTTQEPSTALTTQEHDDDEVSISSEEESDDADEKEISTVPSTTRVSMTPEGRALLKKKVKTAQKEWLDTASRLRVEQVSEVVTAGSKFTFDFMLYVMIASWVASIGLVTDNSVTVVASMLISPLMGPVLGVTFGTVVKNSKLVLTSFINEIAALIICILVGFIMAIIAVQNTQSYQSWPSEQMTSRGTVEGLVVGILVAFPSGMAVALSTLGKNSGGLTGVAISLSLLPPAVNAGICWIYAAMLRTGYRTQVEGDDTNYAFVGTMSFCLTCINIACIWLGGSLMFYIKEVVPIEQKNTFWSHDIKVARRKRRAQPDPAIIDEGIKAALELEQDRACKGELHKESEDIDISSLRAAAARRRDLASDAVEDAFVLSGDGLIASTIIPGGAGSDELVPNEDVWADAKDISDEKAALLDTANKVGGLDQAGALLFEMSDCDEPLHDAAIPDEQVAAKILLS